MNIRCYRKHNLSFIEVTNEKSLKVILCDFGASIYRVYFNDEPMNRTVRNNDNYLNPKCYYGKTIGRTSNRIGNSQILINGSQYNLEENEPNKVLHGGPHGLSNKQFEYVVEGLSNYVLVKFKYLSKHLEGGYPGDLLVEVHYVIYKNIDRFDVKYFAISEDDTPVSLTNHTYFCLGEKENSKLELMVRSFKHIKVDEALLPVANAVNIKKFDLNRYKPLKDEFDHYFYFSKVDYNLNNVSLKNEKFRLDIYTDYPGVQIYTSNSPTEFNLSDEVNELHDSVAIEPSEPFNKINILKAGHQYRRNINYIFKKIK